MLNRIVLCLVVLAASLLPSSGALAAASKEKGLYISPISRKLTLVPGASQKGVITVTNSTDDPMEVSLSIKQFSVKNYSYDYEFRDPGYDWVTLKDHSVSVAAGRNANVLYDIAVPSNAASGGYYFAVFASAAASIHRENETLQVASLLYAQVNGGKAVQSVSLQDAHMPFIITGTDVPYKFDVNNKGNVYLDGTFFAQLEGIFGKYVPSEAQHISLPGTIRTIKGSLPTPLLPGIYKLTYGYTSDSPRATNAQSVYIIFIPPWSVAAGILVLLMIVSIFQKRYRKSKND